MASGTSVTTASDPITLEVPSWLKTLPVAPEYHPTLAEFQDPIAYILKIEKEASSYGICKIVPPIPAPPRKTALANLNRSFAARNGAGTGGSKKASPTFTTRHQQIGFCPRRPRPVQKPVWQSGEQYTLQQFEAKAKQFERTQLKRSGRKNGGSFSELEVETLFWNAAVDKPIQVEYANDMPGSGFAPQMQSSMRKWQEEDAGNVGDTAWNMRGVSRAKGSLLKFMKEEIPGVTSPMVYVAMMFSWFAWHVEDHELHSLNYLHMGAGKTWYGVPRDARLAFEEVVRVQGYGGEVNPLVTFAILGEKTTVMSPEVLVGTGIPCCRLVQNVGDFVVTFPGAYHCGFSHGFNCGEASNIATPEWLNVAKEAAIRRASINYPPMVSHFQLLYDLALSLWSRMPLKSAYEPRSSRLKDKLKGEGEMMIKELFVQNVVENNSLLDTLLVKGSSCVVLPQNKFNILPCSNSHVRSLMKIKSRSSLGLCSREEALEASRDMPSNDFIIDSDAPFEHPSGLSSAKGNLLDVRHADSRSFTSDSPDMDSERPQGEGLLDQGLLSCVACGILSFACVAVVQPTDAAAKYLMSADCSIFNDLSVGLETICGNAKANIHEHTACSGRMDNNYEVLDDNMAHSSSHHVQVSDRVIDVAQDRVVHKGASALDLLASAYGELSDSEEENIQPVGKLSTDEIDSRDASPPICSNNVSPFENNLQNKGAFKEQVCPLQRGSNNERTGILGHPSSRLIYSNKSDGACDLPNTGEKECQETVERSSRNHYENSPLVDPNVSPIHRAIDSSTGAKDFVRTPLSAEVSSGQLHNDDWNTDSIEHDQSVREVERPKLESEYGYELAVMPTEHAVAAEHPNKYYAFLKNSSTSLMHSPDKDSSRMHVFCLEHALEVEKQLQPLGGSSMMVLCHPDYPLIEAQAKIAGEELGITYVWKEIHFKDATEEDQQTIRTALEDEEAIPTNSDWAVKMGVNLYYSANLSKSPLYSKQMPYNSVIYKAFGRSSSGSSPGKPKVFERRRGRKKKLVFAGKWCGKVWMSNQVHPYLAHKNDPEEQEIANKFKDEDMMLLEIDACTAEQAKTPTRNTLASSSSASRTYNRKRKISQENLHVKKAKYAQPDNDNTSAEMVENSSGRCRRFLRSGWKQPPSTPSPSDREKTPQFSESSLDENTGGGPSTRLRSRSANKLEGVKTKTQVAEKFVKKKGKKTLGRNPAAASNEGVMKKGKNNLGKNLAAANDEGTQRKGKKNAGKSPAVADDDMADYPCDVEGCAMSFSTKHDLVLHKRNICPVKGCGKKFFSHKYLVQHRRVHMDDRPLKCPWKGCRMTFKWAWARTEHIRVHTGDRPYICMASGCGQTFRFVSDFSRHKRKTGHVSKRGRR